MSGHLAVAALFLAALALADSEITREEGVLVLTESNFDEALEQHKFILVEFYAPWCGHCKALAPEYAKAAKQLEADGSEVVLGKVDATQQQKLGEKFQVQGYPTLKFFRGGKPGEYGGGRTAPEIVSWLSKKTGPPAKELTSSDQAKEFVEGQDVVVVGFFADKASDNAKVFLEAAGGIDDVQFGIVTEQSLIEEYEAKVDNIVLLKNFDEKRNVFDGEFTADAVSAFVKANQLPLVTEFSDETAPKIFGGQVKVHLLFFGTKSSDEYEAQLDVLRGVARDYKGETLFVTIDADVDENERIMEFFAVKKENTPAFRLVKLSEEDMKKFAPQSNEITDANIRKFLADFKSGDLQPHFSSEDVPEDWDAKPVKVLVGKNFREQVVESDKAVMIEFYAPWCGHCKQLAPIWDQLGEHYESNDDIMVAKMDSTANEIDAVTVQSFPTIYYFPKGANSVPIEFKGSRTLDGFIQFIDSNGSTGNDDAESDDGMADDELPGGEEEDMGLGADESFDDDESVARDEL
ncbi:protein disulfide-isomerase 2-like [Sycon ciliatum]|uniref:protein disulfide-isomerase 2-like n=1 Tax=Sycon ciliatum TaxID=27933 RepID=UPI0020AE8447|eukprot:scpid49983/ scgid24625/ Protein disulfide-isomerase; Cellular thyroid hormone-binding protein; Prolyl 4-hydroxylase subunit beta; Retina cognin